MRHVSGLLLSEDTARPAIRKKIGSDAGVEIEKQAAAQYPAQAINTPALSYPSLRLKNLPKPSIPLLQDRTINPR